MTDRELRRMSRRDLIELLCQMKKEEIALKKRIAELQSRLEDRQMKIEKAGTLADAVIAVNGVLEAAQRAADQYLEEIGNTRSDLERSCSEMLEKTREECARREEETDRNIVVKWQEFNQKVESYIQTHAELTALLDRNDKTEIKHGET